MRKVEEDIDLKQIERELEEMQARSVRELEELHKFMDGMMARHIERRLMYAKAMDRFKQMEEECQRAIINLRNDFGRR